MYLSQANTLENTPVDAWIDHLNLYDNSENISLTKKLL